jgi:hypothetical protein
MIVFLIIFIYFYFLFKFIVQLIRTLLWQYGILYYVRLLDLY